MKLKPHHYFLILVEEGKQQEEEEGEEEDFRLHHTTHLLRNTHQMLIKMAIRRLLSRPVRVILKPTSTMPLRKPVTDTNQKAARRGKPTSAKLKTYETLPSSSQNLPSDDREQDNLTKINEKTTATTAQQRDTTASELSQQ